MVLNPMRVSVRRHVGWLKNIENGQNQNGHQMSNKYPKWVGLGDMVGLIIGESR